jgi:hypothetical protein
MLYATAAARWWREMHKKPAAGFPVAGVSFWIYRAGGAMIMCQAPGAARTSRPCRTCSDATGHECTSGEGVVLSHASGKALNRSPKQPHRGRQDASIKRCMPKQTYERIGLLSDPQVYPCEYVSKRRRLSIHPLLVVFKSDYRLCVQHSRYLLLAHRSEVGFSGKHVFARQVKLGHTTAT